MSFRELKDEKGRVDSPGFIIYHYLFLCVSFECARVFGRVGVCFSYFLCKKNCSLCIASIQSYCKFLDSYMPAALFCKLFKKLFPNILYVVLV